MRRFRHPNPKLSAARHQGWKTRRGKYGPRGHDSSYSRPPGSLCLAIRSDLRLSRLVAVLLGDGVMSEGQLQLDRVEVRKLEDDGLACLHYRPLTGTWGANMMKRIAESGHGR